MSLKFLNLKSFHPTNKANQRALYIAEETEKENKKKEQEALKEFEAENESFKEKIQQEDDQQRTLVNLQNYRRLQERAQAERETALLNPDYKPAKKKRRKKKEKEVSKQLSFLYVQPPGLKAALEKEEEERRSKEAIVDNTVPEDDRKFKSLEEKFPLLKNAPKLTNTNGVSQSASSGKITYKPFGIEIRNVKCTRCGQFGHISMDRSCPLHDYNPLDAKRREVEDPLNVIKKINSEDNQTSTMNDTSKLILDSDDEKQVDETGLSEKERKKLLKKYKKLQKKLKRQREDSEEEQE